MKLSWLKLVVSLMLQVWLVPLCFSQAEAQSTEKNKTAILIGRCVGNCQHDDLSQEYAFALADAARYAKIAIRLCSSERFEIAVAKAKDNLLSLVDELKRRGQVNPADISLLLSNDCLPKAPRHMATEFWVIPPLASLPNHRTNIKLKNVSINVIRKESNTSNIEEFIKELRLKPDSYGVVIGAFFRRPSSAIQRRVRETEKRIKSYPDLKGRFSIGFKSYGIIYTGYVEPQKPAFLIVQILKDGT